MLVDFNFCYAMMVNEVSRMIAGNEPQGRL